MRHLISILGGSIISIVVFSALWSGFVVGHHSYGGDSRLSQFSGTFIFFSIYLLPILIAALSIVVIPTELIIIRKRNASAGAFWRWFISSIVTLSVLAGVTISEVPEHSFGALLCGLVAAIAAALAYERIASNLSGNEN